MLHTFGRETLESMEIDVDAHPISSLNVNGSPADAASVYSKNTALVPYSPIFEAFKAKAATLSNVVINDAATVVAVDVLHNKLSVEEPGTVRSSQFTLINPALLLLLFLCLVPTGAVIG
jgi:hypothetical protein